MNTTIDTNTFKQFGFPNSDYPRQTYTVTSNPNLTRLDKDKELQDSLLFGICEFLCGNHLFLKQKNGIMDGQLDCPSHLHGYGGFFDVHINFDTSTIRIKNLWGCNKDCRTIQYIKDDKLQEFLKELGK